MGAAIPRLAEVYLSLLVSTQQQYWPAAPEPWMMAAQVEKETCITLTHSKCWSPRAELKTSRENGIGFGQATRAYNADGSIRFDKISELRAAHPSVHWHLQPAVGEDPRVVQLLAHIAAEPPPP